MSQPHAEHRNPSDDAWWRRALDATGATMQLRGYEQTGREATWSDAVMNASAAVSMPGPRAERWTGLPQGPLGNVADGFAQRLSEEYMFEKGRMGFLIDNTDFLPNVRSQMARGDVDKTLETAAKAIVTSADPGENGERWHHPDPGAVSDVRNAMSRQLLDGRYGSPPASGNDAVADQNFGFRLGYATADAGVKAMNEFLTERNGSELARSVQHTLGAQPAPRAAAGGERTDGAAARPATAGAAAAKESGTGPRG
ncbi:hypothetical protein AB0L64_31655 [Kribbella sp. NPDC051936]|uniref:hypothetical protein n=1 Tax=Kribbella sp. NPDC051936 TaxID=3154946 RepID=UPI003448A523